MQSRRSETAREKREDQNSYGSVYHMRVWIANEESFPPSQRFMTSLWSAGAVGGRLRPSNPVLAAGTHLIAPLSGASAMDRSSNETAGQECKYNDPDKKSCIQERPCWLRL